MRNGILAQFNFAFVVIGGSYFPLFLTSSLIFSRPFSGCRILNFFEYSENSIPLSYGFNFAFLFEDSGFCPIETSVKVIHLFPLRYFCHFSFVVVVVCCYC